MEHKNPGSLIPCKIEYYNEVWLQMYNEAGGGSLIKRLYGLSREDNSTHYSRIGSLHIRTESDLVCQVDGTYHKWGDSYVKFRNSRC